MPILDAVRKFVSGWQRWQERQRPARADSVEAFLDDLFQHFCFTPQARTWLRQHIRVQVLDFYSVGGGGGWYPDQRLVQLNTIQYEAAIHELAHAIWHEKRQERLVRDGLVAAVRRLAEDDDPRWRRVHVLARHYIYGIATQPGFEQGMLLAPQALGTGGGPQGEWNDWEMFAGLASGCMADIRLLPPYIRGYYEDLFIELPPGEPAPETVVSHP